MTDPIPFPPKGPQPDADVIPLADVRAEIDVRAQLELAEGELAQVRAQREQADRQTVELLKLRDRLAGEMRTVIRYAARAMASIERGEPVVEPSEPAPAAPIGLTVDAGPLPDFIALARFEAELAERPGVTAVHVKRFDGGRAEIELAQAGEQDRVALVAWLAERCTVERAAAGRLVVTVEPLETDR